ncbi:MAG: MFS transporter [Archangiaceae bacterium]|nr:MFS transporter [Archangiaceae bacterium]
MSASFGPLTTDVPARLDRLPWLKWHTMIVVALGVTWILDGLEVTIVGALGGALESPAALGLTSAEVGLSASAYVGGAISGALFFGHLTDRWGRKRLFLWTLALYVLATVATGLSWSVASFIAFRFFTGTAIGGEYAAINSAIDELLPARVRGFAALGINGSYWVGTALGALASTVLLDPELFAPWLGWRLAFLLGAVLAAAVVLVRRHVPESPRWLMLHGRHDEALEVVAAAEGQARLEGHALAEVERTLTLAPHPLTFGLVARTLLGKYRGRTVLGLSLMLAQAFFYNAIFFTYALVLTKFFGVAPDRVGIYLLPFAAGNFLGPLLLGRAFDGIGRKAMIVTTYAVSGVLLLGTGVLFQQGLLTAWTQTLCWCVVFFFGSAAASSAYLTVSELFPLEIRALAIALFYAVGTGAGGVAAPALFGALIGTGDPSRVFLGYALGAALMLMAAGVAAVLGVNAERKSLEELSAPLSSR